MSADNIIKVMADDLRQAEVGMIMTECFVVTRQPKIYIKWGGESRVMLLQNLQNP